MSIKIYRWVAEIITSNELALQWTTLVSKGDSEEDDVRPVSGRLLIGVWIYVNEGEFLSESPLKLRVVSIASYDGDTAGNLKPD